jgi:hypothetical protein
MDCEVIKDLMPLSVENLTSEASNRLISEHVNTCNECRQTLETLKEDTSIHNKAADSDTWNELPNKLIGRIQKSIYQKIIIGVLIALVSGTIVGSLCMSAGFSMAFICMISILTFTVSILISLAVVCKEPTLDKQFKKLGNWTFVFSLLLSIVALTILGGSFPDFGITYTVIKLELGYNILFSLVLRLYAQLRLPKQNVTGTDDGSSKKLYIVTLCTIIAIILAVSIPVMVIENNVTKDNIDIPFQNDSQLIGKWTSIDFVRNPDDFLPERKNYQGNLLLKDFEIKTNGETNYPGFKWTKGYILNIRSIPTAAKYLIEEDNGNTYLLMEWKSGDYTYLHRQPQYYVFRKIK